MSVSLQVDELAFELALRQATGHLEREITRFIRAVAVAIVQKAVERSPVRSGYYRSRWRLVVGEGEGATAGAAAAAAQAYTLGSDLSITNDAPYAVFLEFGTRYMAPQLVLTSAADEVAQSLESMQLGGGA